MTDLSGMWLGTYWQREMPTRFEATLVQGGNSLSGSILDAGYLGEAQISGTVVGRQVQFVKRYLTQRGPTIDYVGTLSEEGDRLVGQWTIAGFDSGPWEAYRSDDDLSASWQSFLAQDLAGVAGRLETRLQAAEAGAGWGKRDGDSASRSRPCGNL